LKEASVYIDLADLKGLLRELGFNTSGSSCSFLDLIRKCQAIVNGGEPVNQEIFMKNTEGPFAKPSILDRKPEQLIQILQDAFYNSGKTVQQIFEVSAMEDGYLDLEGFTFICKKFTNSFNESEIQSLYKQLVPERGQ
jgi:hypothetical protein